jgi:hypothetical protein
MRTRRRRWEWHDFKEKERLSTQFLGIYSVSFNLAFGLYAQHDKLGSHPCIEWNTLSQEVSHRPK